MNANEDIIKETLERIARKNNHREVGRFSPINSCNSCFLRYNKYQQKTLEMGHCKYYLVYNADETCEHYT